MRNIVTVAAKAALHPPEGDNQVAGRCVAAIRAASEINGPLVTSAITDVLTKWRDHLPDTDLARTIGAVGAFKVAWASLGADNIARSRAFLTSAPIEMLIEERAFASGPPAEAALAASYAQAVGRLNVEQLEAMTRKPYPRPQWVPGVLDQVRSVASWQSGERAMRMALRVASCMTTDDLESIASEFVRNNQINEAADMPQLMQLMVEATASFHDAHDVWQRAFDAYTESYRADRDPDGYYNYSEARGSLNP